MKARDFGFVLKRTAQKCARDDIFGLAAQAAYSFAFSLFPTLLLIVLLLGIVGQDPGVVNMVGDFLSPFVPPDTLDLILEYLRSLEVRRPEELVSLSIILTLWTASGVVTAYMKAVNRAYEAHDRPFVRKRLLAFAIVLLSGLLVLLAFLFMVFGPVAGDVLNRYLGVGEFYKTLFEILRFPFALLFLSTALALLYRLAPNTPHFWYEIIPGALVATWLWITVTFSFSLYVQNFGKYDKTYGSLGAVIILLMWMYLTSVAVIVGAEFNAAFGAWMRGEGIRGRNPRHLADEA